MTGLRKFQNGRRTATAHGCDFWTSPCFCLGSCLAGVLLGLSPSADLSLLLCGLAADRRDDLIAARVCTQPCFCAGSWSIGHVAMVLQHGLTARTAERPPDRNERGHSKTAAPGEELMHEMLRKRRNWRSGSEDDSNTATGVDARFQMGTGGTRV